MTTVEVFAPAKINLTLHVTGQRDDGYHLLDSLVTFAGVGDRITIAKSDAPSFDVTGSFGPGVPRDASNLVMRAAMLFDLPDAVAITLDKRLPPASGIGGGSADAAATFRGMAVLGLGARDWETPETAFQSADLAGMVTRLEALGADMPMCLTSFEARVRGIGDEIEFLRGLPTLPAILVTPPCAVSTPSVFKGLEHKDNPPMPQTLPQFSDAEAFADWLRGQRNDLQPVTMQMVPAIAEVIDAIEAQPGNLLARMSGSGATCFGIFKDRSSAEAAATSVFEAGQNWWVTSCVLGGQFGRAIPRPG